MLLIDVINDMDFKGGTQLLRNALPAAKKITKLRDRMHAAEVPVIYVNDNFGQWQSDFNQQIQRCLSPDCPGNPVASLLAPATTDYFVLKPKHSGFYSTSLELLLRFLGIETLILTGFATEICVLYTANDAYMRDYNLIVPSDCVASESADLKRAALKHIRYRLKARVCLSSAIR
jgi:nicotinamidase-related amidase